MIGTITSPAIGSAHHQPNNAFRSKPPNRIADRYVQKSACLESACMAPLPIPAAIRRFAFASTGMTTTSGGDDDSWDASFRRFVVDQRGAGFVGNVNGQRQEAPPNNSQGGPLDPFTPGRILIVMKPPEQRHPGRNFNYAVEAEAHERNRTGDETGDDGDERFEAVPYHGEIFEPLAPANEIRAGRADNIHSISA